MAYALLAESREERVELLRVGLVFLSLVGLVALLVAGYALPGRFINNGANEFEGDERVRAEWALDYATGKYFGGEIFPSPEGVIEALLTTTYRVERIGECENVPPNEFPEPPIGLPSDPALPEDKLLEMVAEGRRTPGLSNFSYEVQRYTPFGIPYVMETEAEAELCDFTL